MSALAQFNPVGIDALSEPSRRFYESSRMKMLTSFIYAALGLCFLGLTANCEYSCCLELFARMRWAR